MGQKIAYDATGQLGYRLLNINAQIYYWIQIRNVYKLASQETDCFFNSPKGQYAISTHCGLFK